MVSFGGDCCYTTILALGEARQYPSVQYRRIDGKVHDSTLPEPMVRQIETLARRHPGIDVMDTTCEVVSDMIGKTIEESKTTDSPALLAYLRTMPVAEGEDPACVFIKKVALEVARIRGDDREANPVMTENNSAPCCLSG